MKRSVWLCATVLVAGGVVGCSVETAGTPVARMATGDTPVDTTAAAPPSTTPTLAALDPCDVLTESAKSALGVTGGAEPGGAPSSRYCLWAVSKPAAGDSYSLGVAIFPGLGLDEVNAYGEKTTVEVDGRRAIRSLRAGGSVCAVSLEVTPTSRVDVQASGADGSALCPAAMAAAELVEPEIP